jgi:hypothetical protein
MPLINQYKSFSKNWPWATRVLSALLIIVVLLTLIRISLPFVINIAATSWFESEGVEAEIFDVNKGFSLGYLGVSWEWAPLFDRLVKINQVEVKSLNIDAMIFDNGYMNIAGIDIKPDSDEEEPEPSEPPSEHPWDATVQKVIFSDIEMCFQQFGETDKLVLDYCGKLAAFDWTGDVSFKPSAQSETSDTVPVYAQGELKLSEIKLLNKQLNLDLLNVASVAIKNINIDTPVNISIDSIGVEKLSAMQRANQSSKNESSPNDAQVFAFDRLAIQSASLSQQNNLKLGKIELTGTRNFVQINKDGRMEYEQWIPVKNKQEEKKKQGAEDKFSDKPDVKKATVKTKAEPFDFSFDEFIFKTKQHFMFVDNSLKEPFVSDIHNIDFKLTGLDSKTPDKMSHALLALAIDKHGSFKLEADISPLSERPNIKGTGEISGVDLRVLAPLTRQHVGHNIKSGQLDASLKINVDKGIIDSNMALVLHHLELKSLSKKEADELNSDFGFPLSSALSLLRDSENAIRLDIPVTGDIDNPDFDPKDAIVKASSKAITTAVLHYYTPFGLIFAAEGLFNLATALNFEPVLFDPGEDKLTPAHKEQLDKLASLMADRPGIHLTLYGLSSLADKNKLFPEPVKATVSTTEQQVTVKSLSKENLASLKQLAESRSSNIKHYLVNEKTIKASRLIECAPEYMPDKISGVEISI